VVAASKEKLEASIKKSNEQLILIILLVLAFSFLVFFVFARYLTKPVSYLTSVANELIKGNYDAEIEEKSKATELLDLNRSLVLLRGALLMAREKNEGFNRQLENEIKARTNDLEITRLRLLEAQEAALLGNYEIDMASGDWTASQTIFSIFETADMPELKNNSWRNLLNPENRKLITGLLENSLKDAQPFQKDVCIKNKGSFSEEKWITITGMPVGKEQSLIRGTIQDISVRKRTENEVRRLSLVAEKTSNSVIITDQKRRIVWVNESTLRITGYSREELIGRTPSMFQFEKTDQQTRYMMRDKLDKLEEVNTEILNRGKSGNEYWLHINIVPLFDEDARHIGFMAVESDITERVKYEEDLRKSRENYLKILENSSEMIHTIDNKGKLIWANRSWKQKLGLANQEVEGLNLLDFLDNNTLEEFRRVIPELISGQSITDLDCVFLSREGNALSLQGRAIPVFENDTVVGSQAYLHDITKIKKAENDLRQVLELTQRQNDRLRNFTHIVSHNLRSHSSNLSGLIYLLNLESQEFNQNIYFRNFEKAVDNLMDVISSLSEVALIETDEDNQMQAINLDHAIGKAISTVFALAQNAGVSIDYQPAGSCTVSGNAGYIDSIILNLLTNAIKYKAENRQAFVKINVLAEGSFVRLSVRDNGLGIDLERQGRKLFGMYKTFHKHPDARGVGLFLTKNQVEAMGGRIEVESKPGEGSVFSVFLRAFSE
jgi:PAS domain S-box-containing protein